MLRVLAVPLVLTACLAAATDLSAAPLILSSAADSVLAPGEEPFDPAAQGSSFGQLGEPYEALTNTGGAALFSLDVGAAGALDPDAVNTLLDGQSCLVPDAVGTEVDPCAPSAVPEPGTFALLGAGVVLMVWRRRRRQA